MTAAVATYPFMSLPPAADEVIDPLRALALKARDGEALAFRQLYDRTRDLAWGVLYRVVGPSSELEDLLQDAYLQLMKALKGYRGDAKVTTFLHRICVNVGLMHLRTARRHPEDPTEPGELPEELAPASQSPERAAQVKQAQALMKAALAELTQEKADVFVYHELLGLRPEEISELTGAPANTVRSRLNRARVDFTAAVTKLKGAAT